MSVRGDLGISPVLLQAITQTLTSSEVRQEKIKRETEAMDKRQQSSKVVSHLLRGMNEPVLGLMSQSQIASDANFTTDLDSGERKAEHMSASVHDCLAAHLALNQSRTVGGTTSVTGSTISAADVSMVNILTTLASQHMKANIKKETLGSIASVVVANPTSTPSMNSSSEIIGHAGEDGTERQQPQIIIYYNNDANAVPSPGNDVIVGELEGDGQSYRVVMHHGDVSGNRIPVSSENSVQVNAENVNSEVGIPSSADTSENLTGSCPICGDKLSGTTLYKTKTMIKCVLYCILGEIVFICLFI